MTRQRRPWLGLAILSLTALAAVLLRLVVARPLDGSIAFGWPTADVAGLRTGAVLAGACTGIALAIAGAMLQALLRNPLADPFILGGSSGAGLGVMAATYLAHVTGVLAWTSLGAVAPASVGAVLALVAVTALGHRRTGLDPLSLVLAGVVVSAMCGAAIMFLQQIVPHGLRGVAR